MNRIVFGISLLLLGFNAYAHPHVFIRFDVNFVTNIDGVTGIRMNWDLDPMFSQSLVEAYDKNQNRKFEPEEIKLLEKEAFSNLENYHYFTYIRLGDEPYRFNYATDFSAELIDQEIRYTFTLPLEKPLIATDKPQELSVTIYDETSFIWMSFTEKTGVVKTPKSVVDYQINIEKNKEEDPYKGSVVRRTTHLTLVKP